MPALTTRLVLFFYISAVLVVIMHSVYRWPGSYVAEANWQYVLAVMSDDRVQVLDKANMADIQDRLLGAISEDQWSQRYRWDAFKAVARATTYGYLFNRTAAEALYGLSRRTAGHSPDLLVARYAYLRTLGTGELEIKRIERRLAQRMPKLFKAIKDDIK